jgi:hypothetical protein
MSVKQATTQENMSGSLCDAFQTRNHRRVNRLCSKVAHQLIIINSTLNINIPKEVAGDNSNEIPSTYHGVTPPAPPTIGASPKFASSLVASDCATGRVALVAALLAVDDELM